MGYRFVDSHTAGEQRNGVKFNRASLERAVAEYQKVIATGRAFGMDATTPGMIEVEKISHVVESLAVDDDGSLIGEFRPVGDVMTRLMDDLGEDIVVRASTSFLARQVGDEYYVDRIVSVNLLEAVSPAIPREFVVSAARSSSAGRLDAVLARRSVLVLSGPSGCGKSSLERDLCKKLGLLPAVSHTTRSPRGHEDDGVHYHFVSAEEFERLAEAGSFLETTRIFDHRYGMTHEEVMRASSEGRQPVLLVLDTEGLRKVREVWPDVWSVWVDAPSNAQLRQRMLSRGDDPDAVDVRMSTVSDARESARRVGYTFQLENADGSYDAVFAAMTRILDAMRFRR